MATSVTPRTPRTSRQGGILRQSTYADSSKLPTSSASQKNLSVSAQASMLEKKGKWPKSSGEDSRMSRLSKKITEANFVMRFKHRMLKNLGIRKDIANYLTLKLNFFPMKFVDQKYEDQFFEINHKLYPTRMFMLGIGAFILHVFLWAFVGGNMAVMIAFKDSIVSYPIFRDNQETGFQIMQAVTVFSYLFLAFAYYIPVLKKNLELSSYAILSSTSIGVTSFAIFGISLTPQRDIDYENVKFNDILITSVAANFKLWSDVFLLLSGIGLIIAIDLFLPTRTRYNFLFHIFIYALVGGVYITSIVIFGNSYRITAALILQLISLFAITILAFLGRFMIELSDRAAAYEFVQNLERLGELEEEVKAAGTKSKSSTAVEDLITIIKQSQAHFANVKLGKAEEFGKAEELLRKALQVLTRTDNLYAVRFAGGGGVEDEVNRRFIEMYANQKKQAKLPRSSRQSRADGSRSLAESATSETLRGQRRSSVVSTLEKPSDPKAYSQLQMKMVAGLPERRVASELFTTAGTDWDLDMLKIAKKTNFPLSEVGLALLEPYISAMWTSNEVLERFVFELEHLYPPNPYHNSLHGATVAHMTACISNFLAVFHSDAIDDCEIASVIIAALGHDAGHPGRNNAYFINTYSALSTLYNDRSPLENLHCCLLFKLLTKESTNILYNTDDETYRSCRKTIINIILATDMKNHFESISLFRVRRSAPDFDLMNNRDDVWQTINMIVKAADLGHTTVDWIQHNEWSCRVTEEFYQQGEAEEQLGYAVSPLCDRNKHADYAKSQKGFIEFVVQPLFKELEEVDQSDRVSVECVRRLVYNRYKWEEAAKENIVPPIPAEIRAIKTGQKAVFFMSEVESAIIGGPEASVSYVDEKGTVKSTAKRVPSIRSTELEEEAEEEEEEENEEEEYDGEEEEEEEYAEDEDYDEDEGEYAEEEEYELEDEFEEDVDYEMCRPSSSSDDPSSPPLFQTLPTPTTSETLSSFEIIKSLTPPLSRFRKFPPNRLNVIFKKKVKKEKSSVSDDDDSSIRLAIDNDVHHGLQLV